MRYIFVVLALIISASLAFHAGKSFEKEWSNKYRNWLGQFSNQYHDDTIVSYTSKDKAAKVRSMLEREIGKSKANINAASQLDDHRVIDSFASIESLPQDIQVKLDGYLVSWAGKDYKNILEFQQGIVFAIEKLPDYKLIRTNIKEEIPKYSISYCMRIPSTGYCYQAGLEMSADGSILKPINIPPLSIHPERIEVFDSADISEHIKNQWPIPEMPITSEEVPLLVYSKKAERFLFKYFKSKNDGKGTILAYIYFDAMSGKYWAYDMSLYTLF